ncbi:MAG: hypothetical protein LUG13_08360 [Oscillospiraceae bacterium]|nr:hypothetical protein [Oscillospiraceae bacterium]
MTYRAIANPAAYHCGYRWLVVDENYNTISKHASRESAEAEAERLNMGK